MGWTDVDQVMDYWRAYVNTFMNLWLLWLPLLAAQLEALRKAQLYELVYLDKEKFQC
jgi:hypothetical protein